MKRVLSAFILVLVLVPLMLLMRWGGEDKGAWSAPRDGLQARLVAHRFIWRAGDEVPVMLRIRDRSGRERDVPAASLTLRVVRRGVVASEQTATVPPLHVAAKGSSETVVSRAVLGPELGLCSIEGTLGDLTLPPLKLRIVKPATKRALTH